MSHNGENFLKGILLFLRKNLVSKNFMDEKRGYHVFPSKIFGLTVPKKFVRDHFGVSEKLGYRKNLCIIGGITIFRPNFFVSQCRTTSYRNPLVFH